MEYTLGELRGGEEVNEIAESILFQSKNYPCKDKYDILKYNSNTYVRVILEYSGFYTLYNNIYGEPFTLGSSSWGQEDPLRICSFSVFSPPE